MCIKIRQLPEKKFTWVSYLREVWGQKWKSRGKDVPEDSVSLATAGAVSSLRDCSEGIRSSGDELSAWSHLFVQN